MPKVWLKSFNEGSFSQSTGKTGWRAEKDFPNEMGSKLDRNELAG